MCHISDRGDRVNSIRIESCESFRTRAEAFISECLAITNDLNGSGIIKCEVTGNLPVLICIKFSGKLNYLEKDKIGVI